MKGKGKEKRNGKGMKRKKGKGKGRGKREEKEKGGVFLSFFEICNCLSKNCNPSPNCIPSFTSLHPLNCSLSGNLNKRVCRRRALVCICPCAHYLALHSVISDFQAAMQSVWDLNVM